MKDQTIAIVGLGYVGLPLALAFGAKLRTIGIDQDETKIAAYESKFDPSKEIASEQFDKANNLEFTTDVSKVSRAEVIIIVVPTPIDQANVPDLRPLKQTCEQVARHLSPGATVVFESTVFPGCTEEVCVPILEKVSGLKWAAGEEASEFSFSVGYSPERINPGDKQHSIESVVKVVSADSDAVLDKLASLYGLIVQAGVHKAPSIKVAEASKVIENTQRDINIALMNELAVIFDRLQIDTGDVLEAASTKWNFLSFEPGLVGGHCIGVDPYYLTHKAQSVGIHPQIVLGGRRTNDGMPKFIAEVVMKRLCRSAHSRRPRLLIWGITFKQNCADVRNSKVVDLVRELESYGNVVVICDPVADQAALDTHYDLKLNDAATLGSMDAVILAVPHDAFMDDFNCTVDRVLAPGAPIFDLKRALDVESISERGFDLWRL